MKIEGQNARPVGETNQAQQTTQTERAGANRGPRTDQASSGGDRVQVSPDARLVSETARAAESAPDIRPEAVARAKAKLESGELGSDPFKLADRIIDDLIK